MKIPPPFNLLSNSKSFQEPLLRSPSLNRMGLHPARVRFAAACAGVRRKLSASGISGEDVDQLRKDGCAAIENFLPSDQFAALSEEVEAAISTAETTHPLPKNKKGGFGKKLPFPGGFDRFDGGTLNRFLDLGEDALPLSGEVASSGAFSKYSRVIFGLPMPASKISVYLTVQGDEDENEGCFTATPFSPASNSGISCAR